VRLVDDGGNILDPAYHPKDVDDALENVHRYLSYCDKQNKNVTIVLAMEYTMTPYWIFTDRRTDELMKLYLAFKSNPMVLYNSLKETPGLWVDAVSYLNLIWDK
jgi:hypothetical protein